MSRKEDIRPRRTLRRESVRRPRDTYETLEELEGRLAATKATVLPETTDTPVSLDRKRIKVAERAFQWRVPQRNQIPSDDHILNLARAILRGDEMPPILVFPIGRDCYVMDGHHRLAAYDNAKWTKPIPAQVFLGTLRGAERAALRANNKDKLPLQREDRTEAAWRLVRQKYPQDSIRTIMEDSGASKGTVHNMRDALRKLEEQGCNSEEIKQMTWNKARLKANGSPEQADLEDWIENEAQKLLNDILRFKLGTRFTKNTDVTALALAKLNPGLPDALMAEWAPEPDLNAPVDPDENDF